MSLEDKINELRTDFEDIGSAIREKTGKTKKLTLDEMATEIDNLVIDDTIKLSTQDLVQKNLYNLHANDLYDIEKIGDRAFYDCPIETLDVPDNINSIGYGAFEECELTSATLPFVGASKEDWRRYSNFGYIFGARSYNDNKNKVPDTLKNITINGGRIEDYAFKDCSSIEKITLSNDIERIGNNAFEGCNFSSNSYYYENGLKYLGSKTNPYLYLVGVFDNSITSAIINENCKFIGTNAFKDNTNLTNITIPNSVEFVGDDAFEGCLGLSYNIFNGFKFLGNETHPYVYCLGITGDTVITEISPFQFPSCKFIGSNAFASNKNITRVSIGSVVQICNNAFDGCTRLSSVYIRELREIGKLAFWNCNITSLDLPSGLERIGASAFKYNPLRSLTIPKNVKKIGESAFAGCKYLQSVELGYGLLQVGDGAFSDCTSLSSVTIPASIKVIDAYAFQNCTSLKEITLPVQVESIEKCAFRNCTALETVTLKALIPPALVDKDEKTTIEENDETKDDYIGSFYGCTSLSSINVISNVETYYKNSIISPEWADYSSIINGYALTEITEDDLYGITEIPANAFKGIGTIKKVTIPASVTKIGDNAFYGNPLSTMVMKSTTPPTLGTNAIPSTITAIFVSQSAYDDYRETWGYNYDIQCEMPTYSNTVTSVNLKGVKTIPANAFDGYKYLKYVTNEGNVKNIGNYAFRNCTALEIVSMPRATKIGDYAFYGCSSLQYTSFSSVSNVGAKAFCRCYSLETISLNSVTSIGYQAFYGCGKLYNVKLGSGLKSIQESLFEDCKSLTSITIPSSVTTIDKWAFLNSGLTSVTIPEGATSIGYRAFRGCPLRRIKIANSVRSFDSLSFEDCQPIELSMPVYAIPYVDNSKVEILSITGGDVIPSNAFKNNTVLTSVSISNVNKIGDKAFLYCKNLYSLSLENVKEIGASAFEMAWQDGVSYSNYTSLRRINLGDALETIGNYAFYGCTAFGTNGEMRELTLPATLKSIGKQAFKKWDYLDAIKSFAITPPSFTDGNSAFPSYSPNKYSLNRIRVPDTDVYRRTVGWSEYYDKEQQYNITIFDEIYK